MGRWLTPCAECLFVCDCLGASWPLTGGIAGTVAWMCFSGLAQYYVGSFC